MKPYIYLFIFCFTIYNCTAQDKSNTTPVGIGLLETNTTHPIALYSNKNDSVPFDIIRFNKRKDGTTKFITKLELKPYQISEGDSYEEGEREINSGLVPIGAELKFRVIDSTQNHFKIITNEDSNQEFFIKVEPQKVYYKSLSQVYENNCSNCPGSKYNPNWNVFETWDRYLKRVEFITKRNLKIYDKPNGKIIFEDKHNKFLPFNVIELKGDWIKLKKGFGREFNFDDSKNYDGWTQWKNGNKISIKIVEQTYE